VRSVVWKKRKYRIVHEPLIAEWCAMRYPVGAWTVNVRVGPLPEWVEKLTVMPRFRRVARVMLAEVDAIVLLPEEVHIIEAMVRDEPGKVTELKIAKDLFLRDPTFKEHWKKRIRLILLTPIYNPFLKSVCEREGIEYVFYRPEWILPYLGSLPIRWRAGRLHGVPFGERRSN